MQKLLKIGGVSVLAIVATTAANAAGYTCENLIEYTSCNDNYTLVDGDCILSCGPGSIASNQSCVKCPVGTYATSGATSCLSCPATGYVDENDEPILATTADDGSGAISDCIVPMNVTIKGEFGLYHFTENCAYSLTPGTSSGGDDSLLSGVDLENEETCTAIGGLFDETYSACYGIPGDTDMLKNIIVYENGECVVKDDDGLGPDEPDVFGASFDQGTDSGQVSYNGEYCECNGYWERSDADTAWMCLTNRDLM